MFKNTLNQVSGKLEYVKVIILQENVDANDGFGTRLLGLQTSNGLAKVNVHIKLWFHSYSLKFRLNIGRISQLPRSST